MKSLARQLFLDRMWTPADLDAAGAFWLRLFGVTAEGLRDPAASVYSVEIHLSGFPRAEAELLASQLELKVRGSDRVNHVVTLGDPDTLVITSEQVPGDIPLTRGAGFEALTHPPFKGLVVEIRVRLSGSSRLVPGGSRAGIAGVALVVVGQLRDGGVLIQSLWRCYPGYGDDAYWGLPCEWEAEWVTALEEFKKSGEVPRGLAKRLRRIVIQDRAQGRLSKLIAPRLGRPRLRGILARFVAFAGLTFLWAVVLPEFKARRAAPPVWLAVAAVVTSVGPVFLLLWLFMEGRLLLTYRAWRAAFSAAHQEPAKYAVLTPVQSAVVAEDPAVRKYTADVQSRGFMHAGDVARAPVTGLPSTFYRVFRAPDGITYLILICECGHRWPTAVWFEAQTFFTGGGRVDSLSSAGSYGYIRSPRNPAVLVRVSLGSTDPVAFCEAHTTAAEAFATDRGLIPIRHERLEDYNRRQEQIHAEERQYYLSHPYSWWDHIRWWLQMPRRSQSG